MVFTNSCHYVGHSFDFSITMCFSGTLFSHAFCVFLFYIDLVVILFLLLFFFFFMSRVLPGPVRAVAEFQTSRNSLWNIRLCAQMCSAFTSLLSTDISPAGYQKSSISFIHLASLTKCLLQIWIIYVISHSVLPSLLLKTVSQTWSMEALISNFNIHSYYSNIVFAFHHVPLILKISVSFISHAKNPRPWESLIGFFPV